MVRSGKGRDQVSLCAPELLAPAGSREAFLGALRAGADAFYLAGQRFGARAYAQNFTEEEIRQSLEEAHLVGRRIYLTANVLTRPEELEETAAFVDRLAEAGLDGVIVQDLGVLRTLHRACPGLPLHASTQMSVTGPEAARLLRELGVTRVVPARELTLEEVIALRQESGMEVETFIHGAMCYGYSGRCLFSSFLGGRSGNRGRCAGTCRLPFRILNAEGEDALRRQGESYPLSMKDMCALPILPQLIEAGIDSFKIEGRMKRPEYAAGVTALYRKYIDLYMKLRREGRPEAWKVSPEDLRELNSLYIRTERCEGYYRAGAGYAPVTLSQPGYAGTEEALLDKIRRRYLTPEETPAWAGRKITGTVILLKGQPARLMAETDDDRGPQGSAEAEGDTVQAARSRPLTEEEVRRRICRTGDTAFAFTDLQIIMDEDIFLPVSRLQELRRQALEALRADILAHWTRADQSRPAADQAEIDQAPATENSLGTAADTAADRRSGAAPGAAEEVPGGDRPRLLARVLTADQFAAAARSDADGIILDRMLPEAATASCGTPLYMALPPVYRLCDRQHILDLIGESQRRGFRGILVMTAEELALVGDSAYAGEILCGDSLYAWNEESAAFLLEHSNTLVLPEEAGESTLRRITSTLPAERVARLVYGRVPLMVTAGCVRRTAGACAGKVPGRTWPADREIREDSFWELEDRRGVHFPVRLCCRECANVIYNSVPISLHGQLGDAGPAQAGTWLCAFTTETGEETGEILRYYRSPAEAPLPDRIRQGEYTTGHHRKGAL